MGKGKPLGKQGGAGVPAPTSKPRMGKASGIPSNVTEGGASRKNRPVKPTGGTAKPPR